MFDSQRREYEIEVTDEAISMRGGLLLAAQSEPGPIHRFLFGYVSVPQSMPQYEEIKNKAMSWMDIG